MLAIRELIEKKNGELIDSSDEIVLLPKHFEEAINLVLTQNLTKK